MRILLHPGFHKTGTSSLQRGAEARMDVLAPHLRLMVTADVIEAARAARKFSAQPDMTLLRSFAERLAEAVEPLDPSDPRALLISAEDLSGYIPGHHGVAGYDAAPPLMNVATAVLRSHFGPDAEVTIWYTTRTARDWQRSVYWQNLRALRLTQEFEEYRVTLTHAARLGDVVRAVADRLGPRARVTHTPIENCGATPLGPLGAALDLLGIPTDDIAPLPAHNVQPDGAAEELLALNRSDLDDTALADAKREVIRAHRRLGYTHRAPRSDGPGA
ncbi:hypothetical protein EI983_15665 [Roseovarius faecimaris]|uniref:Sulfotransferase family protein n=1 Tax=Roseovarius faecimaris TaxID=2494550 RepID=A0A6I6IU56_9RHOB|nr:hypothetical protein [Roseovarius faecimaris]QGX99624.1 hypothetical protein EI983_15665 [Roseovarius faecimaris]